MIDYSPKNLENNLPVHYVSLWEYLSLEIDPSYATAPLGAFCFMTGFMYDPYLLRFLVFLIFFSDALSFSAIFVWCGFQTGNFAQVRSSPTPPPQKNRSYRRSNNPLLKKLALALARLFEGPAGLRDQTFHKADQQALCSLLSFIAGTCVGRIGDKVGPTKRIWLMTGCFISTLFTMAAAIAFWKAGQPSLASDRAVPAWTNTLTFVGLGFMSASLGVQGILGKRLNTQFGTTSM